jgi:hypothetical protein
MKLNDDYKGSISEGTINPRELAKRFNSFLEHLYTNNILNKSDFSAITIISEYQKTFSSAYTDSDMTNFVDWQIEYLNDIAPENCYFGAHPGDGADFGYWEHDEEGES